MSDDLLRKLRVLEADYPGQPLVAQRADLREINQIRSRLGMPLVDASLREIGVVEEKREEAEPKPPPRDHTEAREVYRAYLEKVAELGVHRAYADRVARATAGRGQTPVRPLATLGTGGGPLLCDHCRKPIVLEGGQFHGVPADEAWRRHPVDGWASWILGGLLVEIALNGTLRIYHGYPGRGIKQCCNAARREHEKAEAQFKSGAGAEKRDVILAFLADEFPDMTEKARYDLLNEIVNTMYAYDPGIGVNRPGAGC